MKLRYNQEDDITKFIGSDDALYHFTQKETAIEYILNNETLRLGDFNLTNDPQEYKSKMTSAVGWGWEDKHLNKISEITHAVDQLVKASGFISFCQNRYDGNTVIEEGCLKSRMWSQYGGNHSGICLIFSKQAILQEIEKALSSEHCILSKEVEYKDPSNRRTSTVLTVNGDEIDEVSPSEIAINYIRKSQNTVFFQKQTDYKDENEFRIVAVATPDNSACGKMVRYESALKAIILGDAFPKVYLPTIKALSEKLDVPYRKLHWEKTDYVLLQWNK